MPVAYHAGCRARRCVSSLLPAVAVALLAGACEPGPRETPYRPGVAIDAVEVNGKVAARNVENDGSIAAREGERITIRFSLTPEMRARVERGERVDRVVVERWHVGYQGSPERQPPTGRPLLGAAGVPVWEGPSRLRIPAGKGAEWSAQYTFSFPAPYRSEDAYEQVPAERRDQREEEYVEVRVTRWVPIDWTNQVVTVRVRMAPSGYEANTSFRVFWGSRPLYGH